MKGSKSGKDDDEKSFNVSLFGVWGFHFNVSSVGIENERGESKTEQSRRD